MFSPFRINLYEIFWVWFSAYIRQRQTGQQKLINTLLTIIYYYSSYKVLQAGKMTKYLISIVEEIHYDMDY